MSAPDVRAVQLLGPSAGGIRRHVATLSEALEARRIDAPVVGPAGVMDTIGTQSGVVPVPSRPDPLGLLRARRALAPWRRGASLVHCHGLKAGWTALGGSPRLPVVVTVHNVVLDESAGRSAGIQRVLERRVLSRVDRVIALTGSMADDLSAVVPADRLRIALPASSRPEPQRTHAETRSVLGVGADQPMVVCVGRLHPQKDLATLLRAWKVVRYDHRDAVLVIVGEGPERESLERIHDELGLGDSARLVGALPHAVDALAAADLGVMTSIWEGAALVLAEATQLGLPMVSTPTGLATDLLGADASGQPAGGVIVPIGDAGAVAEALCAMLDDPEAATEIGRRGQQRAVEVFDPDRAVESIVDVYREVME